VELRQQVTDLNLNPNPLNLFANECSPSPLVVTLLNNGSPASYSFDTGVTFSASGSLQLSRNANCSSPLTSPIPLPAGTGELTLYLNAQSPVSTLYLSAPGVGTSLSVNVRFRPDKASVAFGGGSSYYAKDQCHQATVMLLAGSMPTSATSAVNVQLTSSGGMSLYSAANCGGAQATSTTVTIPLDSSSTTYWFRQPASAGNTSTVTSSAASLAGDTRTFNFFSTVTEADGGTCYGFPASECYGSGAPCCTGLTCDWVESQQNYGCCYPSGSTPPDTAHCCSGSSNGSVCD
jgi:hypothetical protein